MADGRWSRVWNDRPMDLELRRRVAEEAVRFLFTPVMLAVGLIVAIVLCTTGISEPTRLLPPALFVVLCLGVPRLNRQKRWLASAAMFSGALTVAIMTAVLLNSVHAPGNSLSVILLLLVMTLFGARWGLVAALLVTLAGAGWLLLDHAGLAIGTVYPSSVTAFSLNTGILLAALFFLHAPHRLLSDALKTARDERAQAEAARSAEAASELAFHAVFDQASVAMALLGPDGRMSQLNQRAQQLLGQTEQSLVGLSLASAPLWDAAQRQLLTHAVTLAASGHGSRHELSLPRSDARPGIYQLAISPFHNTSGGVGHVIVELVDVNDLVETRAMLAQARRLEALGKLSGGVAHDINNMLGAILGACELVRIAHRSGKTQRVEDTVEIIQSSVVRAASLTKQLLAFGRNDRWNSEQLDVGRLLQEVVRLLDRTLHKNIDLVLAPSERPCYVRADAAALEHGLLNLALNAQDAMPDGGTLTIACRTLVLRDRAGPRGGSDCHGHGYGDELRGA
jgi:PAS domain S-box-containing protein